MADEKDRRSYGVGESTITVKWWGILLLMVAVFGYFFTIGMAHENRLTRVEATVDARLANIEKAINQLAHSFEKHTERGNR